jgi:predicted NACHT family NTPase
MTDEPFDPLDIESVRRHLEKLESRQRASVKGSGAVAQQNSAAIGERGVYVRGDSGDIFTGQVIQIVAHYRAVSRNPESPEAIAKKVTGYLLWLRERSAHIELRGIERGNASVIVLPLETAYVSLFPHLHRGESADPEKPRPRGYHELLQLEDRLVVTGGAGGGKTTALLHVAWTLANALLSPAHPTPKSEYDPSFGSGLPLPFFISLAAFSRYRRGLAPSSSPRRKTLAYFISYHLISKQADFGLPTDFFVRLSREGRRIILLLDGLDEVAGEDERAEVREALQELIAGRPQLRMIVTCRKVTYGQARTALAGIRVIEIPPLQTDKIASIALQAYQCIYRDDRPLAQSRAEDLIKGIEELESVRQIRLGKDVTRLISSPLMMRLLLIVHMNGRGLPQDRASLFDRALTSLLQVDYGRDEGNIREL